MDKIDLKTWSRRRQWEHFSKLTFPFYHVSFYLDITPARDWARLHGYSFYHTMCYLVSSAMNEIENFRYRIRPDGVWLAPECHPSFTILKPGSTEFRILTCGMEPSIEAFCEKAAGLLKKAYDGYEDSEGLVMGDPIPDEECFFMTCLPWIDSTEICSERDLNVDDSIPRVGWGKYVKMDRGEQRFDLRGLFAAQDKPAFPAPAGKRLWVNMTVDVNHRLVDGYHIGLFATLLQGAIYRL